ncbi:P-loop containing nucleoside triphosphate hydrolase protein [Camillea tinctor]|nr:P-loop containing nucleoside triphosphate hydrolase protein [Camillea tinctor]
MKLATNGRILKISDEATDKYVGLLTMPILCNLLKSYTIKPKGYLSTAKPEQYSERPRRRQVKPDRAPEHSLRVVVYGLLKEKDAVCKLLSDSELYLQHPSGIECDFNVDYFNPHYLTRPGGEMPKLEGLSLEDYWENDEPVSALDDTTKGRLLRLFDHADGGEIEADVIPSPRLRTHLMEHQVKALGLMIEKEISRRHNLKSPSLWLQEMGLGKTLTLLAWICTRLDSLPVTHAGMQDLRTTLIIAPKYTLYGWQTQIARHINTNVDIVLTTYEILRSEYTLNGPLYSQLWWPHHIRNRESQVFMACCQVRAQYRWCLTGTPIQNSLDDYGALLSFLKEKVQQVNLLPEDQDLYNFLKGKIQGIAKGKSRGKMASKTKQPKRLGFLPLITLLRLVCDHASMLPQSVIDYWMRGGGDIPDEEINRILSRIRGMDGDDERSVTSVIAPVKVGDGLKEGHPARSAKIEALLMNLDHHQAEFNGTKPPKSVVFSCWTKMLDQVEQALRARGFNYQRIDGQSSLKSRSDAMRIFKEDHGCTVMLASIGNTGEGVDFTHAQSVHLLEPHWNPMAEAQAVDRVHRIGQTSPVTITRLSRHINL